MELDADWEEGLPWMLLAIREVIQEALGLAQMNWCSDM